MILSLLAYAGAYSDWQPEEVPRMEWRGYNIAAILNHPERVPAHWARNTFTADQNSTRHAEVRVITEYLEANRQFNLEGFTLYATRRRNPEKCFEEQRMRLHCSRSNTQRMPGSWPPASRYWKC